MTTVAADAHAGVMASDSSWTTDEARGVTRKIWRIRGALVGFAGTLGQIEEVKAWFRGNCAGPVPDVDVTALILRNGRLSVWTTDDGELPANEPKFAIGSGGQAARAAMLAGASCRKAVAIACRIDAASGGPVRIYKEKR